MNWVKYWFAVFIIELFIWAYIIYLHFEIKQLEKQRQVKYPKQTKVVIRTKKDIVRG